MHGSLVRLITSTTVTDAIPLALIYFAVHNCNFSRFCIEELYKENVHDNEHFPSVGYYTLSGNVKSATLERMAISILVSH